MPPVQDFVADGHDQVAPFCVQLPGLAVGQGASLLEDRVGPDHLPGHQFPVYGEERQRALRLRAPQRLFRHLNLAQTVRLDPIHAASLVCFRPV